MTTYILLNIGSGNGLLPDGPKLLHEPILTYHQLGHVTLIGGLFHKIYFKLLIDLKIF